MDFNKIYSMKVGNIRKKLHTLRNKFHRNEELQFVHIFSIIVPLILRASIQDLTLELNR